MTVKIIGLVLVVLVIGCAVWYGRKKYNIYVRNKKAQNIVPDKNKESFEEAKSA